MDLKQIKFGMRQFKTVLAIFLCLIIADWRTKTFHQDVFAFYSIIATVQCIQRNRKHSLQMALNRMGGTVIGAILGSIILSLLIHFDTHPYVGFLLAAVSFIALTNSCLVFKIPDATFTSCTTFFSVVISHGTDVIPYAFAWARTLDTFTGILIALVVNLTFSRDRMTE